MLQDLGSYSFVAIACQQSFTIFSVDKCGSDLYELTYIVQFVLVLVDVYVCRGVITNGF